MKRVFKRVAVIAVSVIAPVVVVGLLIAIASSDVAFLVAGAICLILAAVVIGVVVHRVLSARFLW